MIALLPDVRGDYTFPLAMPRGDIMVDNPVDSGTAQETAMVRVSDSNSASAQEDQRVKRQQSAIAFPYIPLHDVVEMVLKVEGRGHRCRVDELAADLDQQRTSGAFRSRLSAGRMFGATEVVRGDIGLTELGLRIANPDTRPEALAQAFLNVPLYEKVYDKFAGGKLPPGQGIEAEMIRLGVPRKQVQKARQVLIRSADTADYFRNGRDRLVRPAASSIPGRRTGASAPEKPAVPPAEEPMADHPLIRGLVAQLPAQGQRFTPKQRRRWLEAAKLNLELIYAADDDEDENPAPEPTPNGAATAQPQPSWQSRSAAQE
jgi:hypothetical protein